MRPFDVHVFATISILALLVASMFATAASAVDLVTIEVSMFEVSPNVTGRLIGQSAFIDTRSTRSIRGSQLDGVYAGGATIEYEVQPFEPILTDYRSFSYVGIFQHPLYDSLGFPLVDSAGQPVVDRSLVIGFKDRNAALGRRLDELLPAISYSESVLVDSMTNRPDSPEFLDVVTYVGGRAATSAPTGLYEITCIEPSNCSFPRRIRATGALYLIAFDGGPNGDLGDDVGVITYSVDRVATVPEPGTALTILVGLVILASGRAHGRSVRG